MAYRSRGVQELKPGDGSNVASSSGTRSAGYKMAAYATAILMGLATAGCPEKTQVGGKPLKTTSSRSKGYLRSEGNFHWYDNDGDGKADEIEGQDVRLFRLPSGRYFRGQRARGIRDGVRGKNGVKPYRINPADPKAKQDVWVYDVLYLDGVTPIGSEHELHTPKTSVWPGFVDDANTPGWVVREGKQGRTIWRPEIGPNGNFDIRSTLKKAPYTGKKI